MDFPKDFHENYLVFNSAIGMTKPESIKNKTTKCPFCDRKQLSGIIAADGPILLIKNKYPVLQEAFQTVLIETDHCYSELSEYSKSHLYRLIHFGYEQWQAMIRSGEYESVLFFKNHGPLSGGTIRHPHMQIVGLKKMDYHIYVKKEHFQGILITEKNGVQFTVSTKPRVGFTEFNIIMEDISQIDTMADLMQTAAHFILNGFYKECDSYNLFFYEVDGKIAVKMIPRFATSPIYIGYAIPQVSTSIEEIARQVRETYNLE